MAEFADFFVQLLWQIGGNIGKFFKGIGDFFARIFYTDWKGYFSLVSDYAGRFDALGWIMFIITTIILFALLAAILFYLFQLIRRFIVFRSKHVEQDKLLEEIAKLKEQQEKTIDEKNRILDLKLARTPERSETETITGELKSPEESKEKALATVGRFPKLSKIDEKYAAVPSYVFMKDEDMITLPEVVDKFVNFAASQLKLYYTHQTVTQFFAAMATSKIIILEGISGTGKTSLPYAMAKFFNNSASICSVQPSWRDRGELIGYYNDFTKKFNETDFLANLYEATMREDPNFIVLDEMNLARIEYYFADFLSIMEMPDVAEWKIDVVAEPLPSDPKNIAYGKLLVPQNVWFIGTANNDDSTFTITDKVYDRAVALELNQKAPYFDAPLTDSFNCSQQYLSELFVKAREASPISEKSVGLLKELDDFIQDKFKIAFGNRIMKQIRLFVPVYVNCGGNELQAVDFMVCTKILRKFNSLNLPFLQKELTDLAAFITKKFGKDNFKLSLAYVKQLAGLK